MKIARFVNFTDQPFTAHWNGKGKTFQPGKGLFMEEGVARHHAKHLTNLVLIQMGKEGMTSPKFPEQVPDFMELFNQAFIPQDEPLDETSEDAETNTALANLNRKTSTAPKTGMENEPPQIVTGPKEDEDTQADDDFVADNKPT